MTTRDRVVLFTAEGFGAGRIPVAPGTFGSLVGVAIVWALGQADASPMIYLFLWIAMFLIGIPLTARAARLTGRHDCGSVVWDEMTAFPLMYAFVPPGWVSLSLGFVLFRIFDITKPWPIRWFERLPGGFGVMVDDQVAGAWAGLLLYAVMHVV